MQAKAYEHIQKEKSFALMVLMENLIGEDKMQAFVKSWFMYNYNTQVTGESFKYEVLDFISRNFGI